MNAGSIILLLTLLLALPAFAVPKVKKAEIDCLECHGELEKGKSVHAAIAMGCPTCHSALDASNIPHKIRNKVPKGLSEMLPGLCFGCHDKSLFEKKVVHAAVGMGCLTCHNPHASDAASLLVQPMGKLCTTCHDQQAQGRHVMADSPRGDTHPLRGTVDPSKPSRELSCVSCHNPHSSTERKLLANQNASPPVLCHLCHRKISVRTDKP